MGEHAGVVRAGQLAEHDDPPLGERLLRLRVIVDGGDLVVDAHAAGERGAAREGEHGGEQRSFPVHLPSWGRGAAERVWDGGNAEPGAAGCGCVLPRGCRFLSAHLK